MSAIYVCIFKKCNFLAIRDESRKEKVQHDRVNIKRIILRLPYQHKVKIFFPIREELTPFLPLRYISLFPFLPFIRIKYMKDNIFWCYHLIFIFRYNVYLKKCSNQLFVLFVLLDTLNIIYLSVVYTNSWSEPYSKHT